MALWPGTQAKTRGSRRVWQDGNGDPSLATRVFLTQVVLLLVALLPFGAYVVHSYRLSELDRATDQARSVTMTLAGDPWVIEAVSGPDPAAVLGPRIEEVRRDTEVAFIVIMEPDGTRFTHPDPTQVGGHFIGDRTGALEGRVTVEEAVGTLGPSVRVVAPIWVDGEIAALVSTGVVLESVSARVAETMRGVAFAASIGLAAALAGAWWVSQWVRRQTFGLGAHGLARLHSYHDALLHSVRAGLVLVSSEGRVVLVNDEARRLLDLHHLKPGAPVAGLDLDPELIDVLASGRTADAEVHTVGPRAVVVTQVAAVRDGEVLGSVATIADRTELARTSGELDTLRSYTESLRARAHEADNRLHTVAMLVELGRHTEALEYATASTTQTQALTDLVVERVTDPPLAALILGKSAQADESGVRLELDDELDIPASAVPSVELVTIIGNLIDNGLEAAVRGAQPRWVKVSGHQTDDGGLVVTVSDSGPGIPRDAIDLVLTRGFSTKSGSNGAQTHGHGLGLTLVASAARRLGGTIEIEPGPGAVFRVRLPGPRQLRPRLKEPA